MRRDDLKHVIGTWADHKGSTYDVELDDNGTSCSVTTTRSNGEKRRTIGLIQFHDGEIFWGQNYKLQECCEGAAQIQWTSSRRGDFKWTRVTPSKGLARDEKNNVKEYCKRVICPEEASTEVLPIGALPSGFQAQSWQPQALGREPYWASHHWSSAWNGAYTYYQDPYWTTWGQCADVQQAHGVPTVAASKADQLSGEWRSSHGQMAIYKKDEATILRLGSNEVTIGRSGDWWEGALKVAFPNIRLQNRDDGTLLLQIRRGPMSEWGSVCTLIGYPMEASIRAGAQVKALIEVKEWRPRPLQIGDVGTIIKVLDESSGDCVIQFVGVEGKLHRHQFKLVEEAKFHVGDRVESIDKGSFGRVIAVDSEGDPQIQFDDGIVGQRCSRDFKIVCSEPDAIGILIGDTAEHSSDDATPHNGLETSVEAINESNLTYHRLDSKLEAAACLEPEGSAPKDSGNEDASYSIGDRVYGYFYGEWFPATVRNVNCEGKGSVQVVWDGEFSASLLDMDCISPMYVSPDNEKIESRCYRSSSNDRDEEPEREPPSASTATSLHVDDYHSEASEADVPPPPPPPRAPSETHREDDVEGGSLQRRWNSVAARACRSIPDTKVEIDADLDLDVSCVKIVTKQPDKVPDEQGESSTVKAVGEGRDEHGKRRMTQAERKAAKAAQAANNVSEAPSPNSTATMSRSERRRAVKARNEEDLFKVMSTTQADNATRLPEQLEDENEEVDIAPAKRHVLRPHSKAQGVKKTKSRRLQKRTAEEESRWTCPACGEINKEIRSECNNCGGRKPEATSENLEAESIADKCVLCDRPSCTEDHDPCGAKLHLCGKHVRELTSREQRLQKWAMSAPGTANALHALSGPHTKEWRSTFFHEIQKLDLLIELMIEHGEDPDEEMGLNDQTPLELALETLIRCSPGFGKKTAKKGKAWCACCEAREASGFAEGLGAYNVAVLLAWHWREGRGDVMPESEEICNMLAEQADLIRTGKTPHKCSQSDDEAESESGSESSS